MKSEIVFSEEANRAIDLVKSTNKNLFITGKAGTGKSTLLEHIISMHGEDMIVLAPTGIAAINVKGDTIHSFFKLKPGYELDEALHMKINKSKIDKYISVKTILIDEISMVRADILDAIDVFLKRVRKSGEYFGGVRMIFFGDLYQLPPVVSNDTKEMFYQKYKSPYFFSADMFQQKDLFTQPFLLEKIELTKIYRQSEQKFIEVLNAIRNNSMKSGDLEFINQFVDRSFTPKEDENWINLVATNAQARTINDRKLVEIKNPIIEFKSSKDGNIGSLQPNDDVVKVKVGAQVMFIHNDPKKRWVNGTIGVVKSVTKELKDDNEELKTLNVLLENGKLVTVDPNTWDISKYHFKQGRFVRENIGHFTQMPIKLAWAITIHKSQGKTFKNVIIDLGRGGFAHGQCYVALSRCTTVKGLVLKQAIRRSDIIVDEIVNEHYN